MRGSLARAQTVGFALCLASLASAPSACTRTWQLSPDSDGGLGGVGATSGASGANGGAGVGGVGGGLGAVGGGGLGPVGGGGAGAGGFGWMGAGGRGRGTGGFGELGGQGGTGMGFPPGSGGHFGSGCTSLEWSIDVAEVIFVVGHTQSMASSFGNSTSRTAGVINAIQSILKAYPNAVNFGYQEFPARTGCTGQTNACCVADPLAPGSLNMYSWLPYCGDPSQSATSCLSTGDGRPIAQTLMKTPSVFTPSRNGRSNRYVVLITDGPPGGCGEDANDACNTATKAITDLAHSATVPVLGLGDEASGNACVRMMATAGGYFPQPPSVPSKDINSLTANLEQIVSQLAGDYYCQIHLKMPRLNPGWSVAISAYGTPIGADPNNGWEFAPMGQTEWIKVNGKGCRDLQNSPLRNIDVDQCPPQGAP